MLREDAKEVVEFGLNLSRVIHGIGHFVTQEIGQAAPGAMLFHGQGAIHRSVSEEGGLDAFVNCLASPLHVAIAEFV
jgi:hypothetical protein